MVFSGVVRCCLHFAGRLRRDRDDFDSGRKEAEAMVADARLRTAQAEQVALEVKGRQQSAPRQADESRAA